MAKRSDDIAISQVLRPEFIFFLNGKLTKEDSLRFLSGKIHELVKEIIDYKTLYERLVEVDKLNNVLESGFYIPHAKFKEISRFFAALALLPGGFYDEKSGKTVKSMFLLLSPNKPHFFQKHLNLLARLSGIFQTSFIEKLFSFKTPQEVMETIRNLESPAI
ncbi:MAG: PTS sugar transporter subunit IIA [Elusimicrobia bacterium]|nr:PTS sugar transporter subunit IIA [Elusimicrobiota bacterium]